MRTYLTKDGFVFPLERITSFGFRHEMIETYDGPCGWMNYRPGPLHGTLCFVNGSKVVVEGDDAIQVFKIINGLWKKHA